MPLPPSISASPRTLSLFSRSLVHPAARVLSLVLLAAGTALSANASGKGPEPVQRIPLEPFGYQAIASRYLLEGATMLTLDYADSHHLLVTFGVSKLMRRLPDCPEDDEDRTVRAVLLELPSGRELAHTEWRFHDLGQYLWNVGDGQFLLRNRDVLTAFAPLQNLASGEPFAERPFLRFDRRIQAIIVSANNDLLSVETIKPTAPKPHAAPPPPPAVQSGTHPNAQPAAVALKHRDPDASQPDPAPTQISFIGIMRIPIAAKSPVGSDSSSPAHSSDHTPVAAPPVRLVGRLDGRIYTSAATNFPITTEGFLRTKATTRDGVLLDFLTFTGKDIDLGDFTTSCPPRPTFVSPSEFVAFGCRGDAQSLDLAGFNLRGDFLWQINFSDEQAYPGFASAVPAGRFAFSRTVTSTHVFGNETPSMDQLQDQEVRVIQTYNGRQLLRVVTSPIQRAGQNFTLSPDGLALAVIHDNPSVKSDVISHHTSIEVYPLPPITEKDAAQIKLEAAMAPASSNTHMLFSEEEIKAALAARPDTHASNALPQSAPADSQIVGDPIPLTNPSPAPAAVSATGTIPSSDPTPACATLTEANTTPATACPAKPQPHIPTVKPEPTPDSLPEKPRKPPTLYEPSSPSPAAAPPQ